MKRQLGFFLQCQRSLPTIQQAARQMEPTIESVGPAASLAQPRAPRWCRSTVIGFPLLRNQWAPRGCRGPLIGLNVQSTSTSDPALLLGGCSRVVVEPPTLPTRRRKMWSSRLTIRRYSRSRRRCSRACLLVADGEPKSALITWLCNITHSACASANHASVTTMIRCLLWTPLGALDSSCLWQTPSVPLPWFCAWI